MRNGKACFSGQRKIAHPSGRLGEIVSGLAEHTTGQAQTPLMKCAAETNKGCILGAEEVDGL